MHPADIYQLKVKNRNTRTRCEICEKLILKTPERRYWGRSSVFLVNFEHISHLVLMFLLKNLKNLHFKCVLSNLQCLISGACIYLTKHFTHELCLMFVES